MPILAPVVFLRRSAGDELHALRNNIAATVLHQKVNVIRCHDVIEDTKSKALLRFRVLALNVLNGAKQLNGWNVWNWLQRGAGRSRGRIVLSVQIDLQSSLPADVLRLH